MVPMGHVKSFGWPKWLAFFWPFHLSIDYALEIALVSHHWRSPTCIVKVVQDKAKSYCIFSSWLLLWWEQSPRVTGDSPDPTLSPTFRLLAPARCQQPWCYYLISGLLLPLLCPYASAGHSRQRYTRTFTTGLLGVYGFTATLNSVSELMCLANSNIILEMFVQFISLLHLGVCERKYGRNVILVCLKICPNVTCLLVFLLFMPIPDISINLMDLELWNALWFHPCLLEVWIWFKSNPIENINV